MARGWHKESRRHSMARKGVSTSLGYRYGRMLASGEKVKLKDLDVLTGVHSGHDIEWFEDVYDGVDLAFEEWEDRANEFLKTKDGKALLKKHGYDSGDFPDGDNYTFWGEAYDVSGGEVWVAPEDMGTTLFGSWKKNKEGEYEPDKSGEYSAIFNPEQNTVQVVWSRFLIMSGRCSPCYPNQADVDNPPRPREAFSVPDYMEAIDKDLYEKMGQRYPENFYKPVLGYMLPPDMLFDSWVKENSNRLLTMELLQSKGLLDSLLLGFAGSVGSQLGQEFFLGRKNPAGNVMPTEAESGLRKAEANYPGPNRKQFPVSHDTRLPPKSKGILEDIKRGGKRVAKEAYREARREFDPVGRTMVRTGKQTLRESLEAGKKSMGEVAMSMKRASKEVFDAKEERL